jgi:hypothetical protein
VVEYLTGPSSVPGMISLLTVGIWPALSSVTERRVANLPGALAQYRKFQAGPGDEQRRMAPFIDGTYGAGLVPACCGARSVQSRVASLEAMPSA